MQAAEDTVTATGADCAVEELDIPEIYETFLELKKEGKVRFLGVTSHTDPAAIVRKATELGHYDLAMVAYMLRDSEDGGRQLLRWSSAHLPESLEALRDTLRPVPDVAAERIDAAYRRVLRRGSNLHQDATATEFQQSTRWVA